MSDKRNVDLERFMEIIFSSSSATGRPHAISRDHLIGLVQSTYPTADERTIREAVHELRNRGMPICSTGGIKGGYYRAATRAELMEFLEREFHSRAVDLLETESLLRRAADKIWGPEQLELKLDATPAG